MCDFYSAKQSFLNKHFHKTHGIEHVTPDMIKTKVSAKTTPNGTHTPKPDPGLPTTGRPVLMTPSGPISMRNMRREPTQAELAAEDPPLPEIYSCQKCEFQHRSREDFQRHIKKHFNASIDDFQCTECGNTYTSLSSLEKHLFMTHKIRSVLQLDRIDASFRDPIAPRKKEIALESDTFSCQTCQKTFASEEVLKQHSKSHGLAFLKGLK